jgi:uncharacterized membrane protein
MEKSTKLTRANSLFERIYKIGVAIKGFDGLVELIVGLALLISPALVHTILSTVTGELGEHQGRTVKFIADYVARLDGELARSGLTFLILFLILHGLVKLALVYCLLKEIVKAYPYALAILGLFLIYQLYVFILTPTIGMALFTLLDALIIWLVWREYRDLLGEK